MNLTQTARYVRKDIEHFYREGRISQKVFEEYMHAWSVSVFRFSHCEGWKDGPHSKLCICEEQ